MVGGCDSTNSHECDHETLTPQQYKIGREVVDALIKRFGIGCQNVWGHGELQTDRHAFEGAAIAEATRSKCEFSVATK